MSDDDWEEVIMVNLRILIVDDHSVVRAGIRALLENEGGFTVVAEAENGTEAIKMAQTHRPDVVVMDIRLPGGVSGIEACAQIMANIPDTKVLMLTSYAEDDLVKEAIRAGAVGYVLKRVGNRELIENIRTIAHGEAVVDPMTKALLNEVRHAADVEEASVFSDLTPQEMRILALMVEGQTNREIAQKLYLGEGTVRNYVGNILSKLNVSNRAEAAVFAVKHNIDRYIPADED
jgi:two-component system, NarL family, response regulator DevR